MTIDDSLASMGPDSASTTPAFWTRPTTWAFTLALLLLAAFVVGILAAQPGRGMAWAWVYVGIGLGTAALIPVWAWYLRATPEDVEKEEDGDEV